MPHRARWILFSLLLIVGLGAGAAAWSSQAAVDTLKRAEREVTATADRMLATTAAIGAAQQAYLAPGQPDAPWFDQVSTALQSLSADIASLGPRTRSQDAAGALQRMSERLASLVDVDARARETLASGQDLLAADLIYSGAQPLLAGITNDLRALHGAERAAFSNGQASAGRQSTVIIAAAAVLWLIGLAALMRVPKHATAEVAVPATPAAPAFAPSDDAMAASLGPADPATTPPTVDLDAAADLCTALSRVTSTVQLPDLLARAAAVLDAPGLIVWLSAGDELFAVTAHGYDPRVIDRLGPIGRHADNATALCWRTGELRSVPGDMMSHGAIVAPMFGPDACLGVLAAEVRHGRERDAATRAVTAIIAAQLATAVAGWPASSAPPAAATGS